MVKLISLSCAFTQCWDYCSSNHTQKPRLDCDGQSLQRCGKCTKYGRFLSFETLRDPNACERLDPFPEEFWALNTYWLVTFVAL